MQMLELTKFLLKGSTACKIVLLRDLLSETTYPGTRYNEYVYSEVIPVGCSHSPPSRWHQEQPMRRAIESMTCMRVPMAAGAVVGHS